MSAVDVATGVALAQWFGLVIVLVGQDGAPSDGVRREIAWYHPTVLAVMIMLSSNVVVSAASVAVNIFRGSMAGLATVLLVAGVWWLGRIRQWWRRHPRLLLAAIPAFYTSLVVSGGVTIWEASLLYPTMFNALPGVYLLFRRLQSSRLSVREVMIVTCAWVVFHVVAFREQISWLLGWYRRSDELVDMLVYVVPRALLWGFLVFTALVIVPALWRRRRVLRTMVSRLSPAEPPELNARLTQYLTREEGA